MAEVQRRLESFTVELEELTQLGFFSKEECTSLVKKQFEFENKINSMNKSVQDFKEYIAYVVALYRIIKIRRNKVKIGDKKHHLEYRVLQRVKNLYEMAVQRFPQEVGLYFAFFQFCKEAAFQHATNKMCDMMIKYHQSNEEVWLTAARLYFHEKNDALKAIKVLQQGIGVLHTSSALYTECIQYEVFSVVTNHKGPRTESQDEDVNKLLVKIEIYLKQAKNRIKDYKFYTDLLTFLRKFDFSVHLQIDLTEYLMENHADCAESWQFLATRELEGVHYDYEKKDIVYAPGKHIFINAIGIYEKGLTVICQENRKYLWDYYIQCVIDFKNNDHFDKVLNYPRLALTAFEQAAAQNCLSAPFYLYYLELVSDDQKIELLKQANEKVPESVDLWMLRLRIEKARNLHEDFVNTFERACKHLGQEAYPLWELMHTYKLDNGAGNKENIKLFYLSAIEQGGRIAEDFQIKYIQWLGKVNIEECRQTFKSFLTSKPFSTDMFKVMLQIEKKALVKSKNDKEFVDILESMHKTACKQIGDEDVDVWINYIKFLREFKGIHASKDAITKIAIDTRKKLNSELLSEFEVRYDAVMQENSKNLKRKRGST